MEKERQRGREEGKEEKLCCIFILYDLVGGFLQGFLNFNLLDDATVAC